MHFLRTIDILRNVKYIQFPRVARFPRYTADNGRSLFKILFPRRVKWRMIYRLSTFYPPRVGNKHRREHRFNAYLLTIRSKIFRKNFARGERATPVFHFYYLRPYTVYLYHHGRDNLGRRSST